MKTKVLILSFFIFYNFSEALPAEIKSRSITDSSRVDLNLVNGKYKVFVFLSAKCPCSKSHEKILANLANEFNQISFIGVHSNTNESLLESKEHFVSAKLPFIVLQDQDAKIADDFSALKTPHAFIVNGKGEVVYSGGVTNSAHAPTATRQYLREALLSVSKGENPNPREVRSLGCVIARP